MLNWTNTQAELVNATGDIVDLGQLITNYAYATGREGFNSLGIMLAYEQSQLPAST